MNLDNIHQFLSKLCVNNNREWFEANKDWYKECKAQMEAFSEALIGRIVQWDNSVAGVAGKDTVYRIYRDSRFSHDKTPYKTNMGCFIVPGGKSSNRAGYYVHIEPDSCFIGGGLYMPPADELLQIRTAIHQFPQQFLEIIENDEFKRNFTLMEDGKLKTAPKGFPKDADHIDLLRYKHYAVGCNISDEQAVSDDMLDFATDKCRIMSPFNLYINSHLR